MDTSRDSDLPAAVDDGGWSFGDDISGRRERKLWRSTNRQGRGVGDRIHANAKENRCEKLAILGFGTLGCEILGKRGVNLYVNCLTMTTAESVFVVFSMVRQKFRGQSDYSFLTKPLSF